MNKQNTKESGCISITAPSNIAIVKYWGKKEIQLPVNPSISFTLKNALTKTQVFYKHNTSQNKVSFQFLFNETPNKVFEKKLITFFDRIEHMVPWIKHYHFDIHSTNTFPHSSGIASSASSYAALALFIKELHKIVTGTIMYDKDCSNIARIGSGSASRSIYGGWNTWGKSESYPESNDNYAININNTIHPNFNNIIDSILIVSNTSKKVSSTVGHQLMENHPYKEGRIHQANENTAKLAETLSQGDWNTFIEICELEALSLHGLMMSSTPSYTLLEPNSLAIIQKIREFREETGLQLGFTIDAGPNIHVLYPSLNKIEIQEFINSQLKPLCHKQTVIHDEIGEGPQIM